VNSALRSLIRVIPDFPKPGISFKDITPLIADSAGFNSCCEEFAKLAADVDFIAGIEARGFIFGAAVATMSEKGFIPVRKFGKLPGETLSVSYDLEYGQSSLEVHKNLIAKNARVLIIDDVLATGGTACAAIDLLKMDGLQPVCVAFLLEIPALGGKSRIASAHPQIQIQTLLAE
jgi:adenine phosphoribosyltransferase